MTLTLDFSPAKRDRNDREVITAFFLEELSVFKIFSILLIF